MDASGNLTPLPNGAAGIYDRASELTSAALSGNTTSYTYNAGGERLTAAQNGTSVASGTWNGAGQLTTYDNSTAGMTVASYDGTGILRQHPIWRLSGHLGLRVEHHSPRSRS